MFERVEEDPHITHHGNRIAPGLCRQQLFHKGIGLPHTEGRIGHVAQGRRALGLGQAQRSPGVALGEFSRKAKGLLLIAEQQQAQLVGQCRL